MAKNIFRTLKNYTHGFHSNATDEQIRVYDAKVAELTERIKADVEQEIKKTLNAPKYNNRIIMAMPVCCIFLFRKIAPSYLEPLYYGSGRIVMVVVFLLLIVAWWTGTYLSNIRY